MIRLKNISQNPLGVGGITLNPGSEIEVDDAIGLSAMMSYGSGAIIKIEETPIVAEVTPEIPIAEPAPIPEPAPIETPVEIPTEIPIEETPKKKLEVEE